MSKSVKYIKSAIIVLLIPILLIGCKENVRYEVETVFSGTVTDMEYWAWDDDPTDEYYHKHPARIILTDESGEERVLKDRDFDGWLGTNVFGTEAELVNKYENRVLSSWDVKQGDELILKKECEYKTDIFGKEKLVCKIPFVVKGDTEKDELFST